MTASSLANVGGNKLSHSAPLTDLDLHCIREAAGEIMIVFVHGILSSGEGAWGNPSWPDLVARDPELSDAAVYVFTYRTSVGSHTYSISDAANELREHLRIVGVASKRKLVFVCHSMGGLVVRRLLVANRDELAVYDLMIGLFLVASPSLGANDASMLSLLSYALQHTQLAALRFSQSNTWLNDLHTDFKSLLQNGNLRIEGRELLEDRPILVKRWLGLRRQIVEPFSAAQYFHKQGCEPFKVAGSDHISIVKPLHSQAMQHRMLKRFILDFIVHHYEPLLSPVDEYETQRAYDAISRLQPKLEEVASKPEALAKLQHALFETRQYVKRRQSGEPRNAGAEERLAERWIETGNVLFKFDSDLASLCWVKGHGWADDSLWNDPRFRELPVQLDDMLHRLHLAMQKQADAMPATLSEARRAFSSVQGVLNISERVVPTMAQELKQPFPSGVHSVTHRLVDGGDAVEFSGLNQVAKVTVEDFVKLAADERRMIAASEEGMNKLKADFENIVSKGRRSEQDEADLIEIAGQMGTVLKLVLGVIETALGGSLQDHYAAQRRIAEFAVERHTKAQGRSTGAST
ncbi:alpha/beta fold hydrolase [Rhizobium ruizarguesonis]|uniref:alpha/beta fold hydrolase n=1 Tax=Rhizobium ruizarguesonis TaxID=2081791 RepID=UPI0010316570|nr:alpha/beta hydrolase [Rhizobium ruizarguesonis]TBA72899.1 alpha/beta hydrolase [Rhizobium ruizarguesonis]WSH62378.1 alpha/beta hydrolase [Rhizobium ruizarguesonis]